MFDGPKLAELRAQQTILTSAEQRAVGEAWTAASNSIDALVTGIVNQLPWDFIEVVSDQNLPNGVQKFDEGPSMTGFIRTRYNVRTVGNGPDDRWDEWFLEGSNETVM